jgi:hypothetical protein
MAEKVEHHVLDGDEVVSSLPLVCCTLKEKLTSLGHKDRKR